MSGKPVCGGRGCRVRMEGQRWLAGAIAGLALLAMLGTVGRSVLAAGLAPPGPATAMAGAPSSSAGAPTPGPFELSQPAQAEAAGASGTDAAASPETLAQQQLQGLDTTAIRGFLDALNAQLGGAGVGWQSLGGFLRGQGLISHPQRLVDALWGVFVGQLRSSLRLLGELLVLVVFAAVLRQIQGAFESEGVARIADAAVFLALGAVALAGFTLAVQIAREAIGQLSSFMVALLPAIVGLLAASGAPTTAGLLQPVILGALDAVALLIRSLVFPLLLLAAVLDIVGAFSPQFRLTSLTGLMRQVALGLMGVLLTIFLGVVTVQGAAGAVADGVALRAAKYATKAFVPVVGGLFADAAEIVLSSSFLLRSGLGMVGLLAVALIAAVPVLKMLALWLVYRLAGALAQPVGGEATAQVLGGLAGTMSLLAMAVTAVGIMCFLSLSVLVGAGTAAFALR